MRMLSLILTVVLATALAACGYKTPLSLPKPKPEAVVPKPVPAAATPATAPASAPEAAKAEPKPQ